MTNPRILPEQEKRVETGPIRFGKDWTGLFIRGDDCAHFAYFLKKLLSSDSQLPDRDALQTLLGMLQETREE